MIVCVLGCTGYLGSRISSHLYKKGYKVIGVCRRFPKKNKNFSSLFYKVIEGDISKKKTLEKIFSFNFSSLVYTISLNHKDSEASIEKSLNINYFPLVNLCSSIVEKEINTKLIYFSTMQVYGDYSKQALITEKNNKNNKNIYALTHSLCEDLLINMSNYENLNTISLRLSNGYGFPELTTCDCWWLVINDFCSNISKNGFIQLNSDGTPLRDFIHISDIAVAVEKIIKTRKVLPQLMNLASGHTLSMLEIADIVLKEFRKKGNTLNLFIKDKNILENELSRKLNVIKKQKKFKISNDLMKNLKIIPKVSISNGIKDTLKRMEINSN